MPGPHAGKSENGFFGTLRGKRFRLVSEQKTTTFLVVILDSKYSKMTCEAEVTLTPIINKICKHWLFIVVLSYHNHSGAQWIIKFDCPSQMSVCSSVHPPSC